MFRCLVAIIAFISLSQTAGAQMSPEEFAGQIVTGVTQTDLEALVSTRGHRLVAKGNGGEMFVQAATPEGVEYYLVGASCASEPVPGEAEEVEVCRGIHMQIRYVGAPLNLLALNQTNIDIPPLKFWHDGQSLGISRYVLLDGGVSVGNIGVNLAMLIANAAALSAASASR